MQYWKKFNSGKVQRISDGELKKHPEKLKHLKSNGWIRIKSESDFSPYKKPAPKKKKKK